MRLSSLSLSLLPALLVVALTQPALADDATEARGHYDRATSAYALGDYERAADEYEKAFALKADPALLYNAAQARRLSGNKQRALLLYQNYLRVFGDRVPNRSEVQRHIVALKKAIENDRNVASSPPVTPQPLKGRDEATPLPSTTAPEPPAPAPAPAPPAPATTSAPPATMSAPPPATVPAPASAQPALTAAPESVTAHPAERPVWKKPWFWAVVGGAAVVVAVGVGVGVGIGGAAHDPTPSFGAVAGN